MTPAMEAVLREDWKAYSSAVLDENGQAVALMKNYGLATEEHFLERFAKAEARALLMANALRMVRLLQRLTADEAAYMGAECVVCASEQGEEHEYDDGACPIGEMEALLRDLGIEPAEAVK